MMGFCSEPNSIVHYVFQPPPLNSATHTRHNIYITAKGGEDTLFFIIGDKWDTILYNTDILM